MLEVPGKGMGFGTKVGVSVSSFEVLARKIDEMGWSVGACVHKTL